MDSSSYSESTLTNGEGSVIPICNAELRPYEGQKFSSLEEGIFFYKKQGFHTVDPLDVDVSISEDVNVLDDDEVTSKKKRRRGTKSMNDVHHKFVEDCTKANIGHTSTFNLLKEFFGGYDVVGCSNDDDKLQIGNKCHGRYFGLYQRAFKNKNHLTALDNLLAGIGPQIFTDDTTGSSSVDENDSIKNIYSIVVPEEITAHAPDVVITKGGASDKKSRIKSSIEKAIEKASKLHRRCGKCYKVTDHNARSCGRK
ncbi:uncharacterized protein LOC121774419 [Salvia splendens]|uniref:uncharacterized protein LOC121774419 n=1 Tax=Salvia splendens TaxID=180675 RepID=UPI001C268C9C|nr:uncharacterized protein LOC121774419 [Salvia splendens]